MKPEVFSTEEVLLKEFTHLWGRESSTKRSFIDEVSQVDQAAICLSGGGIRSACFCLGVIQSLARRSLLSKFHYLSTVSGGGYIGGWLSRWINEENGDVLSVERKLGGSKLNAAPNIEQINSLRENSNYLTPKLGLLSGDFGAAVVLSVRNIILNWLIFIPAIFLVVTLPNFYFAAIQSAHQCGINEFGAPKYLDWFNIKYYITDCYLLASIYFLSVTALFITTYFSCRFLPTHKIAPLNNFKVILFIVTPSVVWSFSVPIIAAAGASTHFLKYLIFFTGLIVPIIAFVTAGLRANEADRPLFYKNFGTWVLVAFAMSCVLTFGAVAIVRAGIWRTYLLAILGPMYVSWMQTFFSALYVGFRIAPPRDEGDREWLARANALKGTIPQLWVMLALACLLLPDLFIAFTAMLSPYAANLLTMSAFGLMAAVGTFAVVGGKSDKSKQGILAETKRRSLFDVTVTLATIVFVLILLGFFSVIENTAAEKILTAHAKILVPNLTELHDNPDYLAGNWHLITAFPYNEMGTLAFAHFSLAILFFYLAYSAATNINVNRFSLHGLYRNRLIRGYLGSARGKSKRKPDPFTGFDPDDNQRMHTLRAVLRTESKEKIVLYPVINMSLNLVGGDNLAWQERKASSFFVTPQVAGSAALGDPLNENVDQRIGAFICSEKYGGNEPGLGFTGSGISLGTAMTISGAAATPSMGYNSSPATSFLMTLFNVRLGAWLANPAVATENDIERAGPDNALRPLLLEMFGQTNDKGRDIYLSDGGHFDNLGLYEMVRRRCRFIVAVDAGQDRRSRFEDLGNTVRKIFIDFGIEIKFITQLPFFNAENESTTDIFAVAEIRYPETKDCGWLLYLKPNYKTTTAPSDVRAYGAAHEDFPHESTVNQWFTESQFESYRRLGFFLASQIGGEHHDDLYKFFSEASKREITGRN